MPCVRPCLPLGGRYLLCTPAWVGLLTVARRLGSSVVGVAAHPAILKALSPTYAVGFLVGHVGIAFFSLAAVVLAVTGAEALYADMGTSAAHRSPASG